MLRVAALITAFCWLFATYPAQATSCSEIVSIDNSEVKQLIAILHDPDADEFDQILAVEALTCAKRKPVRDMGFRAMLRSPNDVVRADGLFRALSDRSSIVVKLATRQGMSKDDQNFVKANPEIIFDVHFVDTERRCISIWRVNSTKCEPDTGVVVTRNEVVLRYRETKVVLEATPDGRLTGSYSYRYNKNIPAEIEVY